MKRLAFLIAALMPFNLYADMTKSVSGSWRLTGMDMGADHVTCPGSFTLPPGTPAEVSPLTTCGSNEIIIFSLKGGKATYENVNVASLGVLKSPIGYWYVKDISKVGSYITFIDAALTTDPRTYDYALSKDKKTLSITETMQILDRTSLKLKSVTGGLTFTRVGD
jgi:hypothetical protein